MLESWQLLADARWFIVQYALVFSTSTNHRNMTLALEHNIKHHNLISSFDTALRLFRAIHNIITSLCDPNEIEVQFEYYSYYSFCKDDYLISRVILFVYNLNEYQF